MNTKIIAFQRFLTILVVAVLISAGFGVVLPERQAVYAAPDAQTFMVATTGSDTSSCGTSAAPCKTIQYAANKALSGDTILVAAGVYTYNSAVDTCSFLTTRAVVCFVDKHLSILGGYKTSNWTTPDPVANLTVIDGGGSRRGVAIIAYNTTASLRMEGFTIQNGLAQGISSTDDFYSFAFGGGMWAQNSAVTLRNITFRNNRSIGANTSNQYGGAGSGGGLAIQSTKNGVVSILENLVFDTNQALGGTGARRGGLGIGGGLYTYQSAITASDIVFTNNLAKAGNSTGSGIDSIVGLRADAIGGAIGLQIGSNAVLSNIQAIDNQAIGGNAGTASGAVGGGAFGGAISTEQSSVTMQNALIHNNLAVGGNSAIGGFAFGGGIIIDSTHSSLDRIEAIGNIARSGSSLTGGDAGSPGGGGAYITAFTGSGYTNRVSNSIFSDNRIELGAGRNIGGGGAGMTVQATYADISHTTFARNYLDGTLGIGQALLVHGLYGTSGTPANANIRYTIIADHIQTTTTLTSALTVAVGSTANLDKILFANNTNAINTNNKPYEPGTITGLNSLIYETSAGFLSPGDPYYNYHLNSYSPAINRAIGSGEILDIDGEARPAGSYPDLGADEYSNAVIVLSTDSLLAMADDDGLTRYVEVELPAAATDFWTATTSADWIYLTPPQSQMATGVSGDMLTIYFEVDRLNPGMYQTSIEISSAGTAPATVQVSLIKVDQVHEVLLPLAIH